MEKARLFIAIDLPDKVRRKIYQVCDEISDVRWTRQEQLHLTLCFIGDTGIESIPQLSEALEHLDFSPFELTIAGTGFFRPGIFFLEINESAALFSLKKQIDDVLSNVLEFESAARSFIPHITLARFRKRLPPAKSRILTQSFKPLFPVNFKVEKFVLYRSKLNSEGAIHTPLKEIAGTEF